jgi:hypothetical protein
MKSLSTHLIAALLIGSFGLAGDASACNGGGNKGGRGGGYGNSNYNGNNQSCNSNGGGNYGNGGGYYANPNGSNYGQAYEPFHSTYLVQPGDNFYVVSLKEYGNSSAATSIARFNRMAPSDALRPGQRLVLPSISAKGLLSVSRAPAAENLNTTSNIASTSTAKFSQTSVAVVPETSPSTDEVERPSVPTGSVIKLDGQSLGDEKGVVRLRISNVALPVEIVEWTTDSTKVRLPKLDVNGAMKAELEVVRADGSVAATNAIELTSTVDNLALDN